MQVFNENEHGPEYSAGRSFTFNTLCDISKTFFKLHLITIFQKTKTQTQQPPHQILVLKVTHT